jgi:hypothetical protein
LRVLEKGKFPLSTNADEKDQGVYIVTRFTKVDHLPYFISFILFHLFF